MRTRSLPHVTLLALLLVGAAQAQPIWRCGADGRSFSDRPCADGRLQAAADPVGNDRVAAAQDIAERERSLARTLEQQRLQFEAQQPSYGMIPHSAASAAARANALTESARAKRERREQRERLAQQQGWWPKPTKQQKPSRHGTWRAAGPESRQTTD